MPLGDPSEFENTQTETGYIEGLHWVRQTDFLAIATKIRFPPLPESHMTSKEISPHDQFNHVIIVDTVESLPCKSANRSPFRWTSLAKEAFVVV